MLPLFASTRVRLAGELSYVRKKASGAPPTGGLSTALCVLLSATCEPQFFPDPNLPLSRSRSCCLFAHTGPRALALLDFCREIIAERVPGAAAELNPRRGRDAMGPLLRALELSGALAARFC